MSDPAGRPGRSHLADGVRLAVGTLTAVPVPPPRVVDRGSASWAMTLAPLVGAALAAAPALLVWLLGADAPLVSAVLAVGLVAGLTRAMHLDGLADTADGLGSGRSADEALALMRKGDIGPFGVVTLVLVLLAQVTALAHLVADGRGVFAVALAVVVSRLVLPLVCLRGVLPARTDGLGHVVAGSVSPAQAALAGLLAGVVLSVYALAPPGPETNLGLLAAVVAAVGLLAGMMLCWRAVRRLGGITGDVLGACVETTFTSTLVMLVLVR